MIAKRVLTAFLLENNIEDKRISTTLKLTPATITRLKMWINLNKDGFNLVFKKLDKKDKEAIEEKVKTLKDLAGKDAASAPDLKKATEELLTASQKLGEIVYKKTEEEAAKAEGTKSDNKKSDSSSEASAKDDKKGADVEEGEVVEE